MIAAGTHDSKRNNSLVITSDGGMRCNAWPVPGARNVVAVAAQNNRATWVTAHGEAWETMLLPYDQVCGNETLRRTLYAEPVLVRHAFGAVRSVAMGFNHMLFLLCDGRVLGKGANTYNCLGRSNAVKYIAEPEPLAGADVLGAAISVFAGFYSTGIVLETGSAYVMGMNSWGQLGLGDTTDRESLTSLKFPSPVLQLAMYFHGAAVLRNGDLYTWGRNDIFQCGTGDTNVSHAPLLVHGPWSSRGVSSFACCYSHTTIVDLEGNAFVTGATDNLPNETFTRVLGLPPTIVAVTSDDDRVVYVCKHGGIYEGGYCAGGFSDVPVQLIPHPVPLPMALQMSGVNLAPRAIYPAHMLAFAMGLHRRLGVVSACRVLVHDIVLRVKRAGDANDNECEDRLRGTAISACVCI